MPENVWEKRNGDEEEDDDDALKSTKTFFLKSIYLKKRKSEKNKYSLYTKQTVASFLFQGVSLFSSKYVFVFLHLSHKESH